MSFESRSFDLKSLLRCGSERAVHPRSTRKNVFPLVWLAWLTGCGSSPSAESPTTPQREVAGSNVEDAPPSDVEGDPFASEPAREAPHPSATCTEGACFDCGETTCLQGFYCDSTLAACGWLPACAQEHSCDCLLSQLPGCSCETRDGNAFVSCPQ